MKVVVDASVAAKWLLLEPDSEKAQALFRAWTAKRITLLAPQILPAEIAGALWRE
jgi:predicted nucleic acid-binding protein